MHWEDETARHVFITKNLPPHDLPFKQWTAIQLAAWRLNEQDGGRDGNDHPPVAGYNVDPETGEVTEIPLAIVRSFPDSWRMESPDGTMVVRAVDYLEGDPISAAMRAKRAIQP